jgi:RHS repeat-associated protein
MDDRGRIAMIDRDTGGDTVIRYQLADHLGSSTIELDDKANIISYEEYHPFGTTSYQKHNTTISQKRYKYVGKERDNETGMYYYGARYYAAWTCRFVSVDPLAEKYPEWSPYVYCADNPVKYIDPDGREANDPSENKNSQYLKSKPGYIIAFSKTEYGKKYIQAFETGPLKKHELEFIVGKYGGMKDGKNSSRLRFEINRSWVTSDKITVDNINSITRFKAVIEIDEHNIDDNSESLAESIGHEVFLHSVHSAFELNELFNSDIKVEEKMKRFNEIILRSEFDVHGEYTEGGQRDHAECIMGNQYLYDAYLDQLKGVLNSTEYKRAIDKSILNVDRIINRYKKTLTKKL